MSFAGFFQRNTVLAYEIGSTFSGLSFLHIRTNAGAASEQLFAQRRIHPGFSFQKLAQFNDPYAKLKRAIFNIMDW